MQPNTSASSTQSLYTSSQLLASVSASGARPRTTTHTVQSVQSPLSTTTSQPQTTMSERTVRGHEVLPHRVNQPIGNCDSQSLHAYVNALNELQDDNSEGNDMSNPWARLLSFNQLPPPLSRYANCIATQLKTNGFYYDAKDDKVQCFSCRLELPGGGQADSQTVFREHQRISPLCEAAKITTSFSDSNTASNTALLANMSSLSLSEPTQARQHPEQGSRKSNNQDFSTKEILVVMGYEPEKVEEAIANLSPGWTKNRDAALIQCLDFLEAANNSGSQAAARLEPQPTPKTPAPQHSSPAKAAEGQRRPQTSGASSKTGTCDEKKILEENRKLKQTTMCKICMDNSANIVILPCGHLSTCIECSENLKTCPICRIRIKGLVRAT